MLWMLLMVVLIGVAVIMLLRPRPAVSERPAGYVENNPTSGLGSGMGGMLTGVMLGYLVNNFLIDSQQYEAWRSLAPEQLKEELSAAGIMDSAQFDSFSQQLAAGEEIQAAQGEYGQDGVQDYGDFGGGDFGDSM